jgi:hypothetical protein
VRLGGCAQRAPNSGWSLSLAALSDVITHLRSALLRTTPVCPVQYALSMGMAHQLRQVHACMRRLAAVGSGLLAHCSSPSDGAGSASCAQQQCSQQALALAQQLVPLTRSLQALLAIKDLHTPLLLRAMLRPAVVLVSPLLSGSFLAGAGLIGRPVTAAGQVFAIVVGCIVSARAGLAGSCVRALWPRGGCAGGGCRCAPC